MTEIVSDMTAQGFTRTSPSTAWCTANRRPRPCRRGHAAGCETGVSAGQPDARSRNDLGRAKCATALGERYAGRLTECRRIRRAQSVLEATAKAREAGADLIVTFGGGSGTDAGKMIRLALKHDIRAVEEFDRFVVRVAPDGSRAVVDYAAPDVPQIAIPTTLSGGDFNPSAGATDTRTMLKEIFRHPKLVPSVIMLDPAVTVRTPQWLVAVIGHPRAGSRGRNGLRTGGGCAVDAGGVAGDFAAGERLAADASGSERSGRATGRATRGLAVDGAQPVRHFDGRQPWDRARARRNL